MPSGIHSSPRGLATADSLTRKRVAQAGGFAVYIKRGDLFGEARAERGGETSARRHGSLFYSEIAHQRWKKSLDQKKEKQLLAMIRKVSGNYQCTKCGKVRNTYYSARRHIKDKHLK